ncbi:class I histocompatibility antigen, F10 alpha chain-like isoform X2 [Oncorhynchus keta]|uniref:class I histocompatibility antigen, F10 alpha chain-like isoform X2 n=1 Tax=Oncorhynchus keta TaxID=8018 RepID=UPI00227B47AD|nr:class I histocompatibility antigen, F10 alpha chain-like isoform X2 [Oncorhynchus keta]
MMNPIRYVFIGLLLCSFISQNDVGPTVKHVLEYMYTSFNSSHYEVAGLLDGELVDFYSSALKSTVPKKSWNEENTSFGYKDWQEILSARQEVNRYFLSSGVDLRRHFVKHPLTGDIVQMKLGCTVDITIIERKKTEKAVGFAEFAYDGNTVLFLSDNSSMWIPKDVYAHDIHDIVHKWNTQSMKDHLTNFVNVDCPVALDRFRLLERTNSSAPKVYTVPGGSLKPGLINLTCLITGSYPKSSPIELNLFRDNILLTEMEGVHSSGVRPNEDHTYQLRKTVRIDTAESVVYRCDVNHKSFPKPRNYTWEVKKQDIRIYIGLCILLLFPLGTVVLFFKNRWRSEPNRYLAANPGENAALGVQDGGSLIDEAYGSRGSSGTPVVGRAQCTLNRSPGVRCFLRHIGAAGFRVGCALCQEAGWVMFRRTHGSRPSPLQSPYGSCSDETRL